MAPWGLGVSRAVRMRGRFISRTEGCVSPWSRGLGRWGRTEPFVPGIDSAALTYFSWFIIYRAEGGWQLLGRWGVQGGGQGVGVRRVCSVCRRTEDGGLSGRCELS